MYKDSAIQVITRKVDTSILFRFGIKQGDSMALVLFLYIIMVFAETLGKEWDRNNL